MHLVLFKIPIFGGVTIHTYGVLAALGFLLGMRWVQYDAKRRGEDPQLAVDLVFWVIVAAIVGSRLVYVFDYELERLWSDPLSLFKIWEGGLTFHGGLIGALIVSLWYARRHRTSFWIFGDLFAPGIALGHAIGRLGCLMSGCCYGRAAPDGAWFGITFPPDVHAPAAIPLYPTQLMESAGNLLIFVVLALWGRRQRFRGQIFLLYLILYGALRFAVEFYRGEGTRTFFFMQSISNAQVLGLLAIVASGLVYLYRSRKENA